MKYYLVFFSYLILNSSTSLRTVHYSEAAASGNIFGCFSRLRIAFLWFQLSEV